MKIAVTSATEEYLFFLPIVNFCWRKLGIKMMIIVPKRLLVDPKLHLTFKNMSDCWYNQFDCPDYKEATYAQVSRLYASASLADNWTVITTDADLCVFRDEFVEDDYMNVLGVDLVPVGQYPVCFCWGSAKNWKKAFHISGSLQENVDHQLAHIECDHFRGNYWGRDQGLLYEHLSVFQPIAFQNRARPGTQFASRRADRDDVAWRSYTGPTLLDAHLWRPGYTDENFGNIMELLHLQYPDENLDWLTEYRNEYIKLLS